MYQLGKFAFLFLMCCATLLHAAKITIIYPAENDTINIAASDSNFIFGHVTPPQSRLFINEKPVKVYENGAFLAFLPFDFGDFSYACLAVSEDDSTLVRRTVFFTPPLLPLNADSGCVDAASMAPSENLELIAGDIVDVGFRGSPGWQASFSIDGIVTAAPMVEDSRPVPAYWGETVFGQGDMLSSGPVAGFYRGSYIIQAADTAREAAIRVELTNEQGDTVRAAAPGSLTIAPSGLPRIAESKQDVTILRTAPRKSYYYFLPQGVKLWITGKRGRNYRVRLAENEEAWVEDYKIQFLPPGTPVPHQYVQLIRTKDLQRKTRVTVYCENRLPYRIVQSTEPNTLKVLLYNMTADTDWIRYDFQSRLIREIRWEQISRYVYALNITLNQKFPWGYQAKFDEFNNFILDIKKTPTIGKRKRTALQHLTILLDPGHEPDTGAVGPTGYTEKEANLLLSRILADKLRKRGADVKFTRTETGLSLADRFKLAESTDADILLSLHHNAIPAGINPFKSRGSSTYYYHPQSHELARCIQQHLLEELQLPDFGLYWDNLAMCRPTQMPAVLIEPAFMMFPEEEQKIRSDKFREQCADAILAALVEFVQQGRE